MLVDVAKAVRDLLNGQIWSPTFTAVYAKRLQHDEQELAELRVTVVPISVETTLLNRSEDQDELRILIAFQQLLTAEDDSDAVIDLAESVNAWLRAPAQREAVTGYENVGGTVRVAYDEGQLRRGLLESAVLLTYRKQ